MRITRSASASRSNDFTSQVIVQLRRKRIFFASLAVLGAVLLGAMLIRRDVPNPVATGSPAAAPSYAADFSDPGAAFVDEVQCTTCHAAEQRAWTGSHHATAMQAASAATVLGDFSDRQFGKDAARTRFIKRGDKFLVNTAGPDGRLADFEVKYTFGIEPLQQYLLELPRGRLQAFTTAWDTEHRRWFDLSPDVVGHRDELHWTKPAYNWNFMCAECHSTQVQKNYDAAQDSYRTEFAQVNVGCQACHGPASGHLARMRSDKPSTQMFPTSSTAAAEIETCARCHSRRAVISAKYRHGAPLLDTHLPALLDEPLYYADGQIRGEVFEYASFLQSRMHAKGVRCSDCHEPHSLKTRVQGNALCTTCHNETTPALRHAVDTAGLKHKNYDSPTHHFHPAGSAGSQCIACHMPARTYMQLQPRHDHSLRVPRPDLSEKLGTPNACNGCHQDQSADWAAQNISKWYGADKNRQPTYGEALWAGRNRQTGAARALLGLAGDKGQPAVVRATALDLLRGYAGNSALMNVFGENLSDPDPIVRRTALLGLELLPPESRIDPVSPLLNDKVRAVRIEAARLLAGLPANVMGQQAPALDRAVAEYEASQRENADRPEAHLNLGNLYASRGEFAAAEAAYRDALKLDPRFAPAYANLADLKANGESLSAAEEILRAGLRSIPDSAVLHHSLGLIAFRQKKPQQALSELRRAVTLAPADPRYAYVYGVAMHDLSSPDEGLALLRSALERFPNDHDLLLALASYAHQRGDEADSARYIARLRAIEE